MNMTSPELPTGQGRRSQTLLGGTFLTLSAHPTWQNGTISRRCEGSPRRGGGLPGLEESIDSERHAQGQAISWGYRSNFVSPLLGAHFRPPLEHPGATRLPDGGRPAAGRTIHCGNTAGSRCRVLPVASARPTTTPVERLAPAGRLWPSRCGVAIWVSRASDRPLIGFSQRQTGLGAGTQNQPLQQQTAGFPPGCRQTNLIHTACWGRLSARLQEAIHANTPIQAATNEGKGSRRVYTNHKIKTSSSSTSNIRRHIA